MVNDIPINTSPLLTEWFNTGFDHGNYHAWLHGKNCAHSPCRHVETLHALVERLKSEEDWKVFITRVGWLAGFAVGRDQEVGPALADGQTDEQIVDQGAFQGEGDSHA